MAKRRRIGVNISELRKHFGKYLLLCRQVDIVIFRRGKAVAVMVGIERWRRLDAAATRDRAGKRVKVDTQIPSTKGQKR